MVCIGGARSGPPEDSGGIYGYLRLLELVKHTPHPTAKRAAGDRELLAWLGDWDPDLFCLAIINQDLGRMKVKKALLG